MAERHLVKVRVRVRIRVRVRVTLQGLLPAGRRRAPHRIARDGPPPAAQADP